MCIFPCKEINISSRIRHNPNKLTHGKSHVNFSMVPLEYSPLSLAT